MKVFKLKDMKKGWFVGDFTPTAFSTKECEVACKHYSKGDHESKHIHKVATELTVIVRGKVNMNGKTFNEGDIILMEPGEATDFEALTDVVNLVVKLPCVKGDKYLV